MTKISRREFLKKAGIVSIVAFTTFIVYRRLEQEKPSANLTFKVRATPNKK